jgi:hypothetical protein
MIRSSAEEARHGADVLVATMLHRSNSEAKRGARFGSGPRFCARAGEADIHDTEK